MKRQILFGKRAVRAATMLFFSFLIFNGCKNPSGADQNDNNTPNTPRTAVPAELAGRWNSGNVSSSGFYDPSKGKWGDPSGTGFFFNFTSDGYFEFGGILQQSWYGCTTDFFSYKRGTASVAGNVVTIYPHVSVFKKTDSCNPQNNYEKKGSMESETFRYQIGTDAFGNIVLARTWPDGEVTLYRRE